MPDNWKGSTRRRRLPKDWETRRAVILARDPICRLGYRGCLIHSTEVDHIRPGDDHSEGNLQGVCEPCHRSKTAAERPKRSRAKQPHPGLRAS